MFLLRNCRSVGISSQKLHAFNDFNLLGIRSRSPAASTMSDKRKLNIEMDRTFKKIQEGLEIFDLTWIALQDADTLKVREKYEEEVNSQIKKLQRLRDQVRGWIASGEVKDKEPLHKARRDVETRMERLREYERESKTKEYSRAGLAQEKVDPEQKNKTDARQWLSDSISQLNCQIEQFDSELEAMDTSNSRKKQEKDKQDKIGFFEKGVVSHRSHLAKFEAMLRMLDNETLSPKTVFALKDEFEFYMDQAADGHISDADHNTMYYGIEFENEQGDVRVSSPDQPFAPGNIPNDVNSRSENQDAVVPDSLPPPPTTSASTVTSNSATILRSTKLTNINGKTFPTGKKPAGIIPVLPLQQDLRLPKPANISNRSQTVGSNGVGRTVRRTTSKKNSSAKEDSRSPTKMASNGVGGGSVVSGQNGHCRKSFAELLALQGSAKGRNAAVARASLSPKSNGLSARPTVTSVGSSPSSGNGLSVRPSVTSIGSSSSSSSTSPRHTAATRWSAWEDSEFSQNLEISSKSSLFAAPAQVHASTSPAPQIVTSEAAVYSSSVYSQTATYNTVAFQFGAEENTDESRESSKDPSYCTLPLRPPTPPIGPFASLSSLEPNSTEMIWKNPLPVLDWPSVPVDSPSSNSVLSSSTAVSVLTDSVGWQPAPFGNVPHADEFFGDSVCRNPPVNFVQWPQRRSPGTAVFESDIHSKLSTEVLFYVFYFQGDKMARIHAAKDLEMRNWSFYTKLSVWMQRMDFPRLQTADYERGNFRYWDKDNWKEEKLTDFLVDYRYVKNPSEELARLP